MLEIRNVSKSFGRLAAIKQVSFDVRQGTISGLIGPNGSGKTTMFNLVSGVLKPNGGSIHLAGRAINGLSPSRIAALGLVRTFQLTSVYRDMTVIENVVMAHHLSRPGGQRGDKPAIVGSDASPRYSAEAILDFMGLGDCAATPAHLLPGGTQRMLSIASALAARPSILLLDEPLAGLHSTEKASVIARLAELRRLGLTMFLVEHDMKSVMSVCDRLCVIAFGSKIAEGTPESVTNDAAVIEAYLGSAGRRHA